MLPQKPQLQQLPRVARQLVALLKPQGVPQPVGKADQGARLGATRPEAIFLLAKVVARVSSVMKLSSREMLSLEMAALCIPVLKF